MASPSRSAPTLPAVRDRGFHPLRVLEVVRETSDARSFVLDVPDELEAAFAYEAGQFCTFRAVIDGQELQRCYSMSSSPAAGEPLRVTVKRVPGGPVSNWLNDVIAAGDVLEVGAPSGLFRLRGEGDVVAFGAGSGITPIFSIVKTALATTSRRVRLLYANRDRDSVIFGDELDALARQHAGRLVVQHHFDADHGFVGAETVRETVAGASGAECYVCGPGPFMDIVERTLLDEHVEPDRLHIERFTATDVDLAATSKAGAEAATDTAAGTIEVTIQLNGKSGTTEHRPGTTILQTARQLGMTPPFSCESGNCATCMAMLTEGEVKMRTNNALTPEEVEEGWVLTCQAVPTSSSVHVVYE